MCTMRVISRLYMQIVASAARKKHQSHDSSGIGESHITLSTSNVWLYKPINTQCSVYRGMYVTNKHRKRRCTKRHICCKYSPGNETGKPHPAVFALLADAQVLALRGHRRGVVGGPRRAAGSRRGGRRLYYDRHAGGRRAAARQNRARITCTVNEYRVLTVTNQMFLGTVTLGSVHVARKLECSTTCIRTVYRPG